MSHALWIAAERRPLFEALFPDATFRARSWQLPRNMPKPWDAGEALRRDRARPARRARARSTVAARSPHRSACRSPRIDAALIALQAEGFAMRGRFTPGAQRRRMVRAAPAGAHSSLHGQAPARRDRAGAGAGLPALPVRVAARAARSAHARARMRWPPCSTSSKVSKRRRARGKRRFFRRASPSTSPHGSMSIALPGASSGPGWPRARPIRSEARRRCARRRSRCLRDAT